MSERFFKNISGAGSGGKSGGASRVAHEDENTLQSNSVAKMVCLVSAGPCVGLTEDDKSIIFDKTALMASDGNYNFKGVSWEQRTGEPDQAYISGFVSTANTFSVGVEVKKTDPLIRTISGPVDAARITWSLPYLAYQDPNSGDLLKTDISFELSKRAIGTSTWEVVRSVSYNDKCVSDYQETARIELGGDGDWDLRFERITDDSTESNMQNKTYWASTTLLTDGKFQYPGSALVGLSANAKQFGNTIPEMRFDYKGRYVRIPDNYDADARTYTGVWSGTFTIGWTDNPAWVLYDILTDKDNGCGHDSDDVDKYSLYEIAQYCDELVDDGFGGKEPRYTFNYQFTEQVDAAKAAAIIAASFRGLVYPFGSKICFFADMPQDSVIAFNEGCVKDGLFTYEGVGLSARHSVAIVTWFDPDNFCEPTIEVVEDAEMIAEYGWREIAIVAYGCVSRGQAHRMGKWTLDTEKNATQTVGFDVARYGCQIVPGDVVDVFDASYAGLRLSGRITEFLGNTVMLDASVQLEADTSYTLKVMLSDGTMGSYSVANEPGEVSEITIGTTFPVDPVVGAVYGLASTKLAPRQFRILSISESTDHSFSVTGIEYDPTKYARVEQNVKLEAPIYTNFTRDKPKAPTDLSFAEYVYKYEMVLKTGATITWAPYDVSLPVQGYEVEYQRENGVWIRAGKTTGTTLDLNEVDAGTYNLRVRAISIFGIAGDWFTKEVRFFGLVAAPSDVQKLTMHALGSMATLGWDAISDLDLSHYRIKHSSATTGVTWGSSVDLIEKVTGISAQVPVMNGTYLIKAVDLSGTESENAAVVVSTVADVEGFNAVAALSDWPMWEGRHTGTVKDGTTLKIAEGHIVGFYELKMSSSNVATSILTTAIDVLTSETILDEDDLLDETGIFDLGEVYSACRVSAVIDAYGERRGDTWSTLGAWETIGKWANAENDAWVVTIQISYTIDDPVSAGSVWTEWKNLIVGDYTARAFRFRLVLESDDDTITPVVADATITVDMPDRTEAKSMVLVPTSGLDVVFNYPFRQTPAVGITIQNGQSGDYFDYTTLPNVTGFSGRVLDASNNPVQRLIDHQEKGFGRVV